MSKKKFVEVRRLELQKWLTTLLNCYFKTPKLLVLLPAYILIWGMLNSQAPLGPAVFLSWRIKSSPILVAKFGGVTRQMDIALLPSDHLSQQLPYISLFSAGGFCRGYYLQRQSTWSKGLHLELENPLTILFSQPMRSRLSWRSVSRQL